MAAEGADPASFLGVIDGRLQNFIHCLVYSRRAGMVIDFGAAPSAVHGVRTCTSSGAHVFVEPAEGALPGQVGRRFVVALRRCIAIEAVNGVRVDIAFVRNVYFR